VSTTEKYGLAIGLFALALAAVQGMTGVIPPLVGWPVVIGCVIAGVVLIIHGKQKRSVRQKQEVDSQETIGEKDVRDEIPPSSWKGLSEAEFAQVELAFISMKVHHGHTDPDGLIDDQKNRKPLNGPCWRCGKPRFEKGGPLK
jgi:hypothetical protein